MTEGRTIKFQMMLSEEEATIIDDYRFSSRLKSRAQAIRKLCELSLKQEAKQNLMADLASLRQELSEVKEKNQRLEIFASKMVSGVQDFVDAKGTER